MPRRADCRGRSAERHQRHDGRGHGRRRQGRADGHVLSQETRPSAAAGPAALRRGSRRRYRHSGGRAGADQPQAFENVPALWRAAFPVPQLDGHKYDRGHAVVVSGPMSSTGAARLAARGALRAGAGLVTIASPREALAVNAAASLAVMVRPVDGAGRARRHSWPTGGSTRVVLGPGGGVGERDLRAGAGGACRRARGGARCRRHDELCRRPAALGQALKARSGRGDDPDAT